VKITSPVTSTSVATKGAELVAGSSPSRRSRKGNILPASDPNVTRSGRLIHTVPAISR
jgi:hypothetical protein